MPGTADNLLADKADDTDAVRYLAASLGMDAVIEPKVKCKERLSFDCYLCRCRYLVENRFGNFKTLTGHCHALFEEVGFICCGNRNPDYCDMVEKL
ncbi:hypothetical protein EGK75_07710 [Neisseria weixii]|nr:hypothetical protein EGK75_07710 [Neisseria weixii]